MTVSRAMATRQSRSATVAETGTVLDALTCMSCSVAVAVAAGWSWRQEIAYSTKQNASHQHEWVWRRDETEVVRHYCRHLCLLPFLSLSP